MATVDKSLELHFEQPMSERYNQIWIVARAAKKGQPAKVGLEMNAVFLQLAEGKAKGRNVSNKCSAKDTVTYDEVPTKKGDKATGTMCPGSTRAGSGASSYPATSARSARD